VMFASLVIVAVLHCTVASTPCVGAASDTIPDSLTEIWQPTFALSLPAQPQPGRWDPTRFDSATAVNVRAILDSAIAHRLPFASIHSDALMGAAFGKSGKDIVANTRKQFEALIDAREALGENSSESELAAGAAAIRAGVDGKTLQSIRTVRPAYGSAVTSLVVAGDFMKKGISVSQVRDAITALGRASRTDEGINAAQALVARNAARGQGMARDALERYVKANAGGATKNAPANPVPRPPGPPDES
jgi:hypothetical protein